MTTVKEIKHLENLLKYKGCPAQLQTPYAMQILKDCKNNNKSVYDVELA